MFMTVNKLSKFHQTKETQFNWKMFGISCTPGVMMSQLPVTYV
jgi:hypothetical protein